MSRPRRELRSRKATSCIPGCLPEHRPACAVRHQRQGLHAEGRAIPRGRGDGQPVRLMVDMTNEDAIIRAVRACGGPRFLVAANDGRGFVVKGEDLLAEKRTGKQVLMTEAGRGGRGLRRGRGRPCRGHRHQPQAAGLPAGPGAGDGARPRRDLQSYKDADMVLADVKVFTAGEGLSWMLGDRRGGDRPAGLARQPRHGRAAAAERLPEDGAVRVARGRPRRRYPVYQRRAVRRATPA